MQIHDCVDDDGRCMQNFRVSVPRDWDYEWICENLESESFIIMHKIWRGEDVEERRNHQF